MNFVNIEAEQQILGAILTRNDVFDLVADVLSAEHFADPTHARIYELAGARIRRQHLVSPVTMKSALESDEGLKALGGPAYLARIAGAAIGAQFATEYARLIIEEYARRTLAMAAQDATNSLSAGADSLEARAALLRAISGLPEPVGSESSYSLLKAVTESVSAAVEAYQGNTALLRTDLEPLDAIIKGLAPGDLCLVAGATSMGKTSLALEIAKNKADAGQGVVFVSLEMARQQLAERMISMRCRIPYTKLRDPQSLSEDEMKKWVLASQEVGQGTMRIIPKHVRDVDAVYSAARRAGLDFKGGKVEVLVVDYAQLMRGRGKGRYEQMTDVSISLKHLGSILDCPVIALVQLSRDIGQRDDKRPQLYDIKETGQFENDADQVVMCHREEYWLTRQGPKPDKRGDISSSARADWITDLAAVRNRMELIVRKNRHGKVATAEVGFHDATSRFWVIGKDQDLFE